MDEVNTDFPKTSVSPQLLRALVTNRGGRARRFPRPPPPVVENQMYSATSSSTSNISLLPFPVSERDEAEEFEFVKKKLQEELQINDNQKFTINAKNLKIEQLKSENESLKKEISQINLSISNNDSKNEENIRKLKRLELENETKDTELETLNEKIRMLEMELDETTQELVKSEASEIEKTEELKMEKQKLEEENNTLRMLNTEMNEENETLKMLNTELIAENQKHPDPEVQLDGELADTTCSICTEEMRLRKCTPCRRRYHKSIGRTPLYKKWDSRGPISFDYAESIPFQTRQKIRSAMLLWQQHTCIRFEEGGPNVDRLEFFDGGGCSSFVGRVGGTQGISISTPGCDVVGIISHEIGHSLGIFHEQARPDQERHIAINYNNIPLSRWNNFQAVGDNHAETYNLPYDTGSVMHYGPYGFASDPYTPTIRTLERVQQSTIGQRAGPSFLDYQAINMAYGCTESCPDLPCLRNGYPHPNNCSTCACPEGLAGRFCEQVYPSNAQCGGVIFATKEVKYISTPNYPDKFPVNTECNWIIAAPIEGRVFMEFEGDFDFLCEDTCDKAYVEVKYHSDKRLTGARFCCSLLPKNRFISFKNEMIIIMRGYRSSGAGFKAKFWSNLGEPEGVITPMPPTTAPVPEIVEVTGELELESTEAPTTISTTTFPRRTSKKHFFTRKPITVPFTPPTTPTAPTTTVTTTQSTTTTQTTTTTISTTPTQPTFVTGETEITTAGTAATLFPTLSTLIPINPLAGVLPSTQAPDIINSVLECGCGAWSEWQGDCSQECGGCGHRIRKRECKKEACSLLNIQDAKKNETLIAKRLMRGEH
uniref:Metalloendopeptidase n=1 Tax=Caenorhabditis tropicalis TaxID=1561998 RepID=A0A1I7UPV1_9PELO